MSDETMSDEEQVAEVVNDATRPRLEVWDGDLPATVDKARDLLAGTDYLFERGKPVKMVQINGDGDLPQAEPLTHHTVVREIHNLVQPFRIKPDGKVVDVTFPERGARMYLDMKGEWNLRPLVGVTCSPLLAANGEIRSTNGYDAASGLWACNIPDVFVPESPSRQDAEDALMLLRHRFRSFSFADAVTCEDEIGEYKTPVVDLNQPPGYDESAFLTGLLTAVCRPSLWLAPGLLLNAPLNGAGSGKGLLFRSIAAIAYGVRPKALPIGHNAEEFDKRLVGALIQASPMLFVDNANSRTVKSETLALSMTERPAHVRILGRSELLPLNTAAFVCLTGNGISVSEDLVRRFLHSKLDAKIEDPSMREFKAGFLDQTMDQRLDLLSYALMIWRWGRQNVDDIVPGKPLGSFETWCSWCRDPLLALGCKDPIDRLVQVRNADPSRNQLIDLMAAWHAAHGSAEMQLSDLDSVVRRVIDPDGSRSRQFIAQFINNANGSRMGGYVLELCNASRGKWTPAKYHVMKTED